MSRRAAPLKHTLHVTVNFSAVSAPPYECRRESVILLSDSLNPQMSFAMIGLKLDNIKDICYN